MIPKQISTITLLDIEALAANAVAEGRTLEYKAQLPGPTDADKREFLADVISLANTDGGDLIFGVTDQNGLATGVPGVPLAGPLEETLLRLESLLATCIEPRLIGAKPRTFELADGNIVILWRIPASFAAPHRANYKDVRRFYHRNSRGKAEMDVHELRAAFTSSDGFVPRLTALHQEAVRQVTARDLPFKLVDGPQAILSIIPLTVLREPRELDLDHHTAVFPIPQGQGFSWMQALEGFYVYGVSRIEDTASFALTRRTGQVDVFWRAGRPDDQGRKFIWPPAFERTIGSIAANVLAKIGGDGPFAIGLSLVDVGGYQLVREYQPVGEPAWRPRLALPLIVTDDLQPESLLPLVRSFSLAMGEKRPDNPLGKTDG